MGVMNKGDLFTRYIELEIELFEFDTIVCADDILMETFSRKSAFLTARTTGAPQFTLESSRSGLTDLVQRRDPHTISSLL